MEVPEFVRLAALFQQQMVDAPGSPLGFLPGQDCLLVWEQNMDVPVPHGRGDRGGGRGLQGLHPGQNFQGFSLGQGSTAFRGADHALEVLKVSSRVLLVLHPRTRLVPWMRLLQGGFALFPKSKSAELGVRTRGSELGADDNP